jgi:hypothetical protein
VKHGAQHVSVMLVAALAGTSSFVILSPHADGPPPGHTGGFGEPTCTACHADAPLNDGIGRLRVTGLPDVFEPKQEYSLSVQFERPGLTRAGFQLSIRFGAGEGAGRQAGNLTAADSGVQVLGGGSHDVQYAEHTSRGVSAMDDTISWMVRWRAPSGGTVPVVLHVAVNASNDDDSELGDAVYTLERRAQPPER